MATEKIVDGVFELQAEAGGQLSILNNLATYVYDVTGAPGVDTDVAFPEIPGGNAIIRNSLTTDVILTASAGGSSIVIGRGQEKLVCFDGARIRSTDEEVLIYKATVSLIEAGAGNADTALFKLPTRTLVQQALIRGVTAVVGGPSTLSLGLAAPFNEILLAAGSPAAGAVIGAAIADLGADMATNGQAYYAAGATITLRNATGAQTTAGEVEVTIIAMRVP